MINSRIQINLRTNEEEKARYQDAADADPTTPDLTAWIKKQCDAAYKRYKNRTVGVEKPQRHPRRKKS